MDAATKEIYLCITSALPLPAPDALDYNDKRYQLLETTIRMPKSTHQMKLTTVLFDIVTGQADDSTIERAADLEKEAPDLWKQNQWLRMVGGTEPGGMDKAWNAYIADELEDEHRE